MPLSLAEVLFNHGFFDSAFFEIIWLLILLIPGVSLVFYLLVFLCIEVYIKITSPAEIEEPNRPPTPEHIRHFNNLLKDLDEDEDLQIPEDPQIPEDARIPDGYYTNNAR